MAEVKNQSTEDYFDSMAGDGLDGFTADTLSTTYLGIVQPGSAPTVIVPDCAGTWRNSTTGDFYGTEVEVVVLAFKSVWCERNSEPPYNTVGRYEPNTIKVTVEQPKTGSRGFPKMTNPVTGNKVEALFMYAVTLYEHPEAGVLYFSPTASSMGTCKAWNTQIKSQRRPSGAPAPLHAFSWKLKLELVQNPKKPAEKMAKFTHVEKGRLLDPAWHKANVIPQIAAANNTALLAAPETASDADAED